MALTSKSAGNSIGRGPTIAVMQPYLFPYIGYYQLAHSSGLFVFLDDVTYIKQGWINRNRLLYGMQPGWFTVPLSGAGSNVVIGDVEIDSTRYPYWRRKFFSAVQQHYHRAPMFEAMLPLLETVFPSTILADPRISSMARRSITCTMQYLGFELDVARSSAVRNAPEARGVDRVLDLCRHFDAKVYINSPGGKALYDRQVFEAREIRLAFLAPTERGLALSCAPDGTQLSLLHGLMYHDAASVRDALTEYSLQ